MTHSIGKGKASPFPPILILDSLDLFWPAVSSGYLLTFLEHPNPALGLLFCFCVLSAGLISMSWWH